MAQWTIGEATRPKEEEDKEVLNWTTGQKEKKKVLVQQHSPIYYRYFVEGYAVPLLLEFSLKSLIMAQICQRQETEADESAILKVGATPEDGIACLQQLYYPNTKDWPLYAKVGNLINRVLMPILSLPVIKQHMPHLTSFKERTEHLRNLKKQIHSESVSIQ